jgi:metal-responsive CopG/Arc/MetJ family transcriptional regulator
MYYIVFMDVLTVRLDDNISKKINVILKEFNYSTKTDFIREAIRAKVTEMEREQEKKAALAIIDANFGKFKNETISRQDFEPLRRQAGKEFIAKLEKKFNQK